jgi:hypothetical protein
VLWLLGVPNLAVWAPALMYLGGWRKRRQLSIGVGMAAVVAGIAVGFLLLDALREHLPEAPAEALAARVAVIPVSVVLVVWTRLSPTRR